MFHKILIANRGEIAVRIIRACREMGIKTVAVYSEADKDALHAQLADEAVCIGPAPASESYLNMERILSATVATKAEAIHPGFGFLSENSKFVRMCEKCNVVIIGPSADVIDKMGNKSQARKTMQEAGVPVVPGTKEPVYTAKEALEEAKKIGNSRVFNLIVLGVAAQHMDFTKEQWYEVIEKTVPPKTIEINKKAFDVGYYL